MPNDSIRSNTDRFRTSSTDRIRAACEELENALENFNRSHQPDSPSPDGSPADGNDARSNHAHMPRNGSLPAGLEQIQTQLASIRRQLDELS